LFAVILSVVGVFDAASAAGPDAPLASRHANLIPPSLNPVISLVSTATAGALRLFSFRKKSFGIIPD
jgi:hypothetical protein